MLCQLSYGAVVFISRAGGTRTHDRRLKKHVLQIGSRSCAMLFAKTADEDCESERTFSRLNYESGRASLGGTRTHISRFAVDVLQLGSQSCFGKAWARCSSRSPLLSTTFAADSGHTRSPLGEMQTALTTLGRPKYRYLRTVIVTM